MKISLRAMGPPEQVAALVTAITDVVSEHFEFTYGRRFEGLTVDGPYENRGSDGQVRVYLTARIAAENGGTS